MSELLLIDDAEFARDILAVMLAEAHSNSTLSWKPDYASGLEALLTGSYEVCLLDYRLGERSGIDLLREARGRGVRTPIIVLTGHGSNDLDREAMREGASDYLVKGEFTAETLDRTLRYQAERTRAGEALRQSEERYALAMEGSNDGLWDWHVDRPEMHFSARWKSILGFAPDQLPNLRDSWWARVHVDDVQRLRRDFDAHIERSESTHFENEHRVLHRDGTWRYVLARGKVVRNAEGRATRMAGSMTDVTVARSRDALTGLASRTLYLERVDHAFNRLRRDEHFKFALLVIDLDRFKNVNDGLGHDAGDELLVALARRLEGCVRAVDTVARLGGDEFVVLLDESREPDGALRVANRIIETLSRPFEVGTREVFTGVSIGIAHARGPSVYESCGDLLRDADTAMNRAKAAGRGRVVVFDPGMHARAMKVLSVESGLRRALECNELEVHYQPVVGLDGRGTLGFEALVRWRHPERGLISPAEFIPVAEDSNLIVLLDLHVLRTAAAQLRTWRDAFKLDLSMSVNASRRHFDRTEYATDVQQALEIASLPAYALHLEVTESLTLDLSKAGQAQLQALGALGVKLYVDDFGVGYSSLSMLHTLPFAGIKLDRSFISQLDSGAESREVVKAILAMSRALRLDVVAEGVETDQQAALLRNLGCPCAQGYFFGRPMPVQQANAWLGAIAA